MDVGCDLGIAGGKYRLWKLSAGGDPGCLWELGPWKPGRDSVGAGWCCGKIQVTGLSVLSPWSRQKVCLGEEADAGKGKNGETLLCVLLHLA